VQDCEAATYSGLDADIGVVTTTNLLRANLPAYERLLKAGLNVVCHGVESYYPYGNDPVVAERIDYVAREHNVTFTGSGIWDMSRIWSGIVVAGPCTQLRALNHRSVTCAENQSFGPDQLLQIGVGMSVDEFRERGLGTARSIAASYKTIPEHVLAALGYTITGSTSYVEPVVLDAPLESTFMGRVIPAGESIGSKVVGEVQTKEGVTGRAEIELRLACTADEVDYMSWAVEGKPRARVRVERDDTSHATAACLFNRIPDVIAAPPGIVLVSELGPLTHTALL
jgi:2,4-diaminopentanoate dehydrogenase